MAPDINELEKRMRPGQLSAKGFLGDTEQLTEIIEEDAKTLAALGISYNELADKLDQLLDAAESAPGHKVKLGHFVIKVIIYPGFQFCPWSADILQSQCTKGGWVNHASVDWHIVNKNNGREMKGPGLIVHLIREHHFFEGHGSPYRVDPSQLASLLELNGS